MHFDLEPDGEQGMILRLSGALTVEHAGELRKVLVEALEAAAKVTIELGDDLETDIAGLQLLCSAHRTSVASGKQLLLKKKVPESFRQGVEAAGLLKHQGCRLNPPGGCFWAGDRLS